MFTGVRSGSLLPMPVEPHREERQAAAAAAVVVAERRVAPSRRGRRSSGTVCCARCSAGAADNARLRTELQESRDELREATARVVVAGDTERRRLERNLHDGAQQRLVALSLMLGRIATRLDDDSEEAALLAAARSELTDSIKELRELAHGLHPAVLSDRGLEPALESLAARAPVPVALTVDLEQRVPAGVEAAAYYLVAEALTNVGKYAAAGHAAVTVTRALGDLVVEIADDGAGGADPTAGSGLRGLADRIAALGGRLFVSSPVGAGTTVRAEIPCRPVAVAAHAA
jgi:signal transduction histidine kinase